MGAGIVRREPVAVGRDGTVCVCAAGLAAHAARWDGVVAVVGQQGAAKGCLLVGAECVRDPARWGKQGTDTYIVSVVFLW